MTKRKLTRQQAWRISKIQDERRERADKREQVSAQVLAGGELGPEQEGLVIAHFGTQVEVEGGSAGGGAIQRCHLRSNLDALVTGDRVIWCAGDPNGVVVARQPRHSELMRPDAYGKLKAVAANIDQIIVVIAPLPEPHANFIDRYLVAAEAVTIPALILLNKSDLIDDANRAAIEALLAPYPALGYACLQASCKDIDGLASLRAVLANHTSVFVGHSGVGKTSLVNMLLPEANARVGALSATHHTGTHTTTTAQWFHLPTGGALIDSPGIRDFGLWHMDKSQVEHGFKEFDPLLGRCKFRDCQHQQEPDCALLAALQSGAISASRLASYRQIIASLTDSER